MKRIVVPLSTAGIERLERELADYERWQREKGRVLAERLAALGVQVAKIRFNAVDYVGLRDAAVTAEQTPLGYAVKADGKSVLFLEFGTGLHGYGHMEANALGFGPGTWSDSPVGKGHWDDPRGWWLPKSAGGWHTDGNPPAMAMYEARKAILRELPQIVKEVFSG